MRGAGRALFVLVLALLVSGRLHAAEQAPQDLRASWVDRLHVRLEWTQTSAATGACIAKTNPNNMSGFIGCVPSRAGRMVEIIPGPPPTDALYHPHTGDSYRVSEQAGSRATSNPAIITWLRFLALARR